MQLTDFNRPRLQQSLLTILAPVLGGKTPTPKVDADAISLTVNEEIDGEMASELRQLAASFGAKVFFKRSGAGLRVAIQ